MELRWGLMLGLCGSLGLAGCAAEGVDNPEPDVLVPNLPDDGPSPDDIGTIDALEPGASGPGPQVEIGPQVVVEHTDPSLMVVDEQNIYWVTEAANTNASVLMRMANHGHDVPTELANARFITGLADAGNYLFWTDLEGGVVGSTAKDSGLSMTLSANSAGPFAVAAFEGRAFWTDIDSGAVMALVNGQELMVARNAAPYTVTVAQDRVFWVDAPTRTLYAMHFEDAEVVKLASEIDITSGIIADGDHVYWVSTASDAVYRTAVEDGWVQTVADRQVDPASLTLYGDHVYWTTGDGTVVRQNKDSLVRETLARDQATPTDVAVTSGAVYWVNRGDGTIMRLRYQ